MASYKVSPSFAPFQRLPPELRLRVWHCVLRQRSPESIGRIVELHHFNSTIGTVTVSISTRYPPIFHVNREARYEAIQQSGGELVPISMGYKSIERIQAQNREARYKAVQKSSRELVPVNLDHTSREGAHLAKHESVLQPKSFAVYINFKKNTLFISEQFSGKLRPVVGAGPEPWTQTLRRRVVQFTTLLPVDALLKITKLQLGCGINEPWNGGSESDCCGLELLRLGNLNEVVLVCTNHAEDVLRRMETAMKKTGKGLGNPWTSVSTMRALSLRSQAELIQASSLSGRYYSTPMRNPMLDSWGIMSRRSYRDSGLDRSSIKAAEAEARRTRGPRVPGSYNRIGYMG
ncbi:hypothetical protein K491DRAFT_674504 [Lophiostoma macrostomum CBS 122681]|uniref:2EXR domain-containing protein n=1 Tax=Lophiostoma macrostomum CBS 122681 TaxID=1314788 RepID=A0A6A6TN48_9PLEO|nr:hypothetical protein K491DRAFT_674504 [Lophiostoma macrostomum CBS 122681]